MSETKDKQKRLYEILSDGNGRLDLFRREDNGDLSLLGDITDEGVRYLIVERMSEVAEIRCERDEAASEVSSLRSQLAEEKKRAEDAEKRLAAVTGASPPAKVLAYLNERFSVPASMLGLEVEIGELGCLADRMAERIKELEQRDSNSERVQNHNELVKMLKAAGVESFGGTHIESLGFGLLASCVRETIQGLRQRVESAEQERDEAKVALDSYLKHPEVMSMLEADQNQRITDQCIRLGRLDHALMRLQIQLQDNGKHYRQEKSKIATAVGISPDATVTAIINRISLLKASVPPDACSTPAEPQSEKPYNDETLEQGHQRIANSPVPFVATPEPRAADGRKCEVVKRGPNYGMVDTVVKVFEPKHDGMAIIHSPGFFGPPAADNFAAYIDHLHAENTRLAAQVSEWESRLASLTSGVRDLLKQVNIDVRDEYLLVAVNDAKETIQRLAAQVEELKGELEQIRIDRVSRSGEFQYAAIHRDRSGQDAGSINYAARVGSIDALADPEKRSIIRCAEQLLDSIRRCMPQPAAPPQPAAAGEQREKSLAEHAVEMGIQRGVIAPMDRGRIRELALQETEVQKQEAKSPSQSAAAVEGTDRRMLQFVEPHPTGGDSIVTVPAAKAIAWQRRVGEQREYQYKNDEQALEDFVACHWAECLPAPTPAPSAESGEPIEWVALRQPCDAGPADWIICSKHRKTTKSEADRAASKIADYDRLHSEIERRIADRNRIVEEKNRLCQRGDGENKFLVAMREALGMEPMPAARFDEMRARLLAEVKKTKESAVCPVSGTSEHAINCSCAAPSPSAAESEHDDCKSNGCLLKGYTNVSAPQPAAAGEQKESRCRGCQGTGIGLGGKPCACGTKPLPSVLANRESIIRNEMHHGGKSREEAERVADSVADGTYFAPSQSAAAVEGTGESWPAHVVSSICEIAVMIGDDPLAPRDWLLGRIKQWIETEVRQNAYIDDMLDIDSKLPANVSVAPEAVYDMPEFKANYPRSEKLRLLINARAKAYCEALEGPRVVVTPPEADEVTVFDGPQDDIGSAPAPTPAPSAESGEKWVPVMAYITKAGASWRLAPVSGYADEAEAEAAAARLNRDSDFEIHKLNGECGHLQADVAELKRDIDEIAGIIYGWPEGSRNAYRVSDVIAKVRSLRSEHEADEKAWQFVNSVGGVSVWYETGDTSTSPRRWAAKALGSNSHGYGTSPLAAVLTLSSQIESAGA